MDVMSGLEFLRLEVARLSGERDWWQATDSQMWNLLGELAEKRDWQRFVIRVLRQPDKLHNLKTLRLKKIVMGDFAHMIVVFDTMERRGDEWLTGTREFNLRRGGAQYGAKGIVFVRSRTGAISHFAVLTGDFFPVAGSSFDCFGGTRREGAAWHKAAAREISEQLGVPRGKIESLVCLDEVFADLGALADMPMLFAALVRRRDLPAEHTGTDPMEYTHVYWKPVREMREFCMINRDGRFLECVARLWAKGILRRGWLGRVRVVWPREN
ncbi:hypothetical protein IJJ12_01185 [bacterium]|nr:hypothetical protein [bacterium]